MSKRPLRTTHARNTAGNNERKDALMRQYCDGCIHYDPTIPPYLECRGDVVPRSIVPEGVLYISEITCSKRKEG